MVPAMGAGASPTAGSLDGRGAPDSERASECETRLLCSALGTTGEPSGHRELAPASQFLRLSQARGHLCAGQVFIHKVHLRAPIRVRVHVRLGIRFSCAVAGGPGSQRAGEDEPGLEGCSLRATGLPPSEGEVVAAAKSLGLPQTHGLLGGGDAGVDVHGTLR